MKDLKTRIFSGIIALCMVVTMFPISVCALDEQTISQMEEMVIDSEDNTQKLSEKENKSEAIIQSELENVIEEDKKTHEIKINEEQTSEITQNDYNKDAELLENEPISGQCGDNLYWDFDTSTGTLTISGIGDMDNWSSNVKTPWKDYREKIKIITVQNGVTSIGSFAFSSCNNLISIDISNTVTKINQYAFQYCYSLNNVIIPSSVISIGNLAFFNCSNLDNIKIPRETIDLGHQILDGCDKLISAGPIDGGYNYEFGWKEAIPDHAFEYCSSLTNVNIPDTILSIGSKAFKGCSGLKSINIPNSVTVISEAVFSECSGITTIDIPTSVNSIKRYAFSGCNNLKKITIPSTVINIDDDAFFGCNSLRSAGPIGGGYDYEFGWINTIPDFAFANCSQLSTVTIPDSISIIGGHAFYNCKNLTDINIPNNITNIGTYAFFGCEALSKIIIPKTVIKIGYSAFKNCDKLISAGPIGGGYNYEFGWTEIIPENAFYDCDSLTRVIIPDSIKRIGDSAFWSCNGIGNINIPDSVTNISSFAFKDCDNLSKISIPNMSYIGLGAFENCDNLTDAVINGTIYTHAFEDCKSLKKIVIMEGTKEIYSNAFYGCAELKDIVIPVSLKYIYENAFQYSGIENIYYAGDESEWERISIKKYNEALKSATIHYNSTEADIPDDYNKNSYVAGILKSYNPQEQKIYFEYYDGVTSVYEYKITDQTVVEDWDIIIGKPVLVSYIPGEYGTDTLSRYVITVQLAEPIIGNVDTITESTITLDGKVFDINLDSLIGLEYYIGETVACYVINDIIVDMKKLNKETGILNAGSNTSVTIDGVQYAAIFNGIPPYLPAPELWFEHEVEYYFYNDGVNQIIYKISLKSYSSTFTAKLTKWEGNTVTFEDDTIRQVAEDVAFDSTLIGKWVDYTVKTTADGGNVISSIILAKPKYKTEVKKLVAWNDGNPQFSDGTTMGVFIIGDQYDPIMIGRWVKLTIKEDLNTGTRITGISLVEPSSKGDFKLLKSTDIYLKNNQYSFDGQNYEDSSKFEIEFKISIQNIVEGVKDTILSEMKKDYNMNLTVEDIQVIEPNGFNFDWFGLGEIGDVKGLEIQAGEIREVTGFIRPDMRYFVDEKEVTETISCKIVLTNGDIFEKDLLFTIHNLDYEEPSTGGDGEDGGEEDIEFTSWEKGLLSEFYKAKDIDVTMQLGEYSLLNYFDNDIVEDISKIVSAWACILKTDLADETKGTLPTCLKIQVPMNKDNDKHQATIFLKYKNLHSSSYASLSSISYVLKDNETGRTLISNGLFSASSSASFSNFADGVNTYLKVKYGEEAKDFCKKIMRDAISDSIKDFANVSGQQYINTMLEVLTQFDELKGYIDQTQDVLQNPIQAQAASLSEFNKIASKHATIKCPVDVFVYDEQNNLCGKIENNVVTFSTNDVFLYVENNMKSVWMNDNYHFELISTDLGYMDYSIEEYSTGEKTREVTFNKVPLYLGLLYSAECPQEMNTSSENYVLISNTGNKIYPTDDTNENVNIENGNSGGGSVTPISYSISIVDTDGGTITINPKTASKDKKVTITAVPDEGYKLDTLSVSDKNGNQIEFTKKTDTEYTFKMPASKVTVNAIFSKVIVAPEPSSMPFTDVPENAWYYDAVKYIYENNMMQGISNTEFAPNLSMNRAMIVTVLHRLENTPETTITNQFSDVESNQWYTEAVQWAFENDIVNGYSSDKFAPMDNVTREQLAVILYNYTNYKGGNTDIVGDLTAFQDADDISNWSKNAISWAIGSGLLSGKGNGILDPKGTATRAEVAQILMNFTK